MKENKYDANIDPKTPLADPNPFPSIYNPPSSPSPSWPFFSHEAADRKSFAAPQSEGANAADSR